MALEVDYAGHTGLFNASAVASLAHISLHDPSDLRDLVTYYGSINGLGSTVVEVPIVGAADAAASTNESADAANQDFTTSSQNITVARQSIVREVTDLHRMAGSVLTEEFIAQDLYQACASRFTDMLAALFASLSVSVGSTSTPLSVDTIYAAKQALQNAGVPKGEPVACVLHPEQLQDLEESMRAESSNADVLYANTQDMLMRKGPGFAFSWRGIDFYSCNSITQTSSAHDGAMFARGCFGYVDGMPDSLVLGAGKMFAQDGAIWIEKDRQPRKGTLEYVANYYVGVSEIEDARGVRIRSIDD